MFGILLIDKPAGITSHDVVNEIRRRFGTRRVGHAGTLDPAATGLLIVAIGPATRFLQYLPLEPKEYDAEVTFGRETTTQDGEGEVVAEKPVPQDLAAALEIVLPKFSGLIQQIPPMYSAVKKGGRALYEYARQGKEVERTPRTIHIEKIEIESVASPTARMRVICSGGTYIRTLAHDLGGALGCGAFLSGLNRTKVGKFELKDAIALREVGEEHVLPLTKALPPVPLLSLEDQDAAAIRQGQSIGTEAPPNGPIAGLLAPDGSIIGIARVLGNVLKPECVIPSEAYGPI